MPFIVSITGCCSSHFEMEGCWRPQTKSIKLILFRVQFEKLTHAYSSSYPSGSQLECINILDQLWVKPAVLTLHSHSFHHLCTACTETSLSF